MIQPKFNFFEVSPHSSQCGGRVPALGVCNFIGPHTEFGPPNTEFRATCQRWVFATLEIQYAASFSATTAALSAQVLLRDVLR